jgi:hypothetical protein
MSSPITQYQACYFCARQTLTNQVPVGKRAHVRACALCVSSFKLVRPQPKPVTVPPTQTWDLGESFEPYYPLSQFGARNP